MEKGTLRFVVTIAAPGGHGGYPHLSRNPDKIAAARIAAISRVFSAVPEWPREGQLLDVTGQKGPSSDLPLQSGFEDEAAICSGMS